MPVRFINSRQNTRLKELRRALTSPGRDRMAALEGPHLLEESLRAGLHVPCVFAAQGCERILEPLHLPPEIEILFLPKAQLDAVLSTETPQPVAALVEQPAWSWNDLLGRKAMPLLLILAGLQDPGNLGTILRSAEAFGAAGIVSLPGTVNPWNPKVVRASAGSVLRMPLVAATERGCFEQLRKAGVQIYATAVRGAQLAGEIDLAASTALVIGNEGNGIPDALAAQADGAVSIPCSGPVESLNAAVAASILLYEAARQRAAKPAARPARRRAR